MVLCELIHRFFRAIAYWSLVSGTSHQVVALNLRFIWSDYARGWRVTDWTLSGHLVRLTLRLPIFKLAYIPSIEALLLLPVWLRVFLHAFSGHLVQIVLVLLLMTEHALHVGGISLHQLRRLHTGTWWKLTLLQLLECHKFVVLLVRESPIGTSHFEFALVDVALYHSLLLLFLLLLLA